MTAAPEVLIAPPEFGDGICQFETAPQPQGAGRKYVFWVHEGLSRRREYSRQCKCTHVWYLTLESAKWMWQQGVKSRRNGNVEEPGSGRLPCVCRCVGRLIE